MASTNKPPIPVVEQTTAEFRIDWDRLSTTDRKHIRDRLEQSYELLNHDKRAFLAMLQRPIVLSLRNGLGSSLYSMRAGRDFRVILAVDDDPLFTRTIITLFRAVPTDELGRAYRSIAHSLYAGELIQNGYR